MSGLGSFSLGLMGLSGFDDVFRETKRAADEKIARPFLLDESGANIRQGARHSSRCSDLKKPKRQPRYASSEVVPTIRTTHATATRVTSPLELKTSPCGYIPSQNRRPLPELGESVTNSFLCGLKHESFAGAAGREI